MILQPIIKMYTEELKEFEKHDLITYANELKENEEVITNYYGYIKYLITLINVRNQLELRYKETFNIK